MTSHAPLRRIARGRRELFYLAENRLMSVPVVQGGEDLELGTPRTLFVFLEGWVGGYEPAPDGDRSSSRWP